MVVRDTSLLSFEQIIVEGLLGDMQLRVFEFIKENPHFTDREISDNVGLPINAVTGRRNELVKMGCVVDGGKREQSNGRLAYAWMVPDEIDFKPLKFYQYVKCPTCNGRGEIPKGQTCLIAGLRGS